MAKTVTVVVLETKDNTPEQKDKLRIVDNLITFYPIEELAEHGSICSKTLQRAKKNIPRTETDKFIYRMGQNVFYSPSLLFLTKKHSKKIRDIDYARMLSAYSWNYTFTIGFEKDYTSDQCRRNIERFIDHLKQKLYAAELQSRKMVIFFSLERYQGRPGYHIHGAMGFFSTDTRIFGKQIFESYYPKREVDRLLEEHDCTDFWVEYIIKRIGSNPDHYDWDFIS